MFGGLRAMLHAADNVKLISREFVSVWKMTKVFDRNWVTFRMSGHLEATHLVEIQKALADAGMGENVGLDLSNVTVIAQDAVRFLAHLEANSIDLRKCQTYIRQWIVQDRRAMKRLEQLESTG